MASVFGTIITAGQLEQATLDLLQKYFPSYLREVERATQWIGDPLPTPKNYMRSNNLEVQSGELIPKVVVVSPGLFDLPQLTKDEGGTSYYKATWQMGIGIATAAETIEKADDMAKMYAAAACEIMLHHQDLEAENLSVSEVTWIDESYDDIQSLPNQIQQFRAALLDMGVEVEYARSRWGGITIPDESEQLIGEVETVDTEVVRIT